MSSDGRGNRISGMQEHLEPEHYFVLVLGFMSSTVAYVLQTAAQHIHLPHSVDVHRVTPLLNQPGRVLYTYVPYCAILLIADHEILQSPRPTDRPGAKGLALLASLYELRLKAFQLLPQLLRLGAARLLHLISDAVDQLRCSLALGNLLNGLDGL